MLSLFYCFWFLIEKKRNNILSINTETNVNSSNEDCLSRANFAWKDNMMCAYATDKGHCFGDFGGPLLYFQDGHYIQTGKKGRGDGGGRKGPEINRIINISIQGHLVFDTE